MELCEELLMRDVGWRRRRRATSFRQKAASSPCVRYNTITHNTDTATVIHYNIGSRPTVLSFPSAQNFIIVQCFAIALSGTPPILYMFELSICVVIALAIKSHHGGSPSSTPEEHRVYTCLHGL